MVKYKSFRNQKKKIKQTWNDSTKQENDIQDIKRIQIQLTPVSFKKRINILTILDAEEVDPGTGGPIICWISQVLYPDNPLKIYYIRKYIIYYSSNIIYTLYKKYGQNIALFLIIFPIFKLFLYPIFYYFYLRGKYGNKF